jgi:hypothetical protein
MSPPENIEDDTQDAFVLALLLTVVCPPEMNPKLLRATALRLAMQLDEPERDEGFARAEAQLETLAARLRAGDFDPPTTGERT